MKLAGRELGVLDVESDRENAFGSDDRVLLETVATRLARYLAGPGKYLVRKARQGPAPASGSQPQARGPQAASVTPRRFAVVGEK
jgi:hypothetical protein